MVRFIENRVCFSRFLPIVSIKSIEKNLNGEGGNFLRSQIANAIEAESFSLGKIKTSIVPNQLEKNYLQDEILVQFDCDVNKLLGFSETHETTEGVQFEEVRIVITNLGFYNVQTFCWFSEELKPNLLESASEKILKVIDQLEAEFNSVLKNCLHRLKDIVQAESELYDSLEFDITDEDNTLANYHIIFPDSTDFNNLSLSSNQSYRLSFDNGLEVSSMPGGFIFGWDFGKLESSTRDQMLLEVLAIDFLALAESFTIKSAIQEYNFILESIDLRKRISSADSIRSLFNYNSRSLMTIKLHKYLINIFKRSYWEFHRSLSSVSEMYQLLKDSENSVKFAIEGLESMQEQKSNKRVQFILALISSLTIYSVSNDFISIISSKTVYRDVIAIFQSLSFISIALLLATALGVFVFFYSTRNGAK